MMQFVVKMKPYLKITGENMTVPGKWLQTFDKIVEHNQFYIDLPVHLKELLCSEKLRTHFNEEIKKFETKTALRANVSGLPERTELDNYYGCKFYLVVIITITFVIFFSPPVVIQDEIAAHLELKEANTAREKQMHDNQKAMELVAGMRDKSVGRYKYSMYIRIYL